MYITLHLAHKKSYIKVTRWRVINCYGTEFYKPNIFTFCALILKILTDLVPPRVKGRYVILQEKVQIAWQAL